MSSAQNSVSSLWHTIIGSEELTEFSGRNSVSRKKLTEFGVWNRTLRNRIRPRLPILVLHRKEGKDRHSGKMIEKTKKKPKNWPQGSTVYKGTGVSCPRNPDILKTVRVVSLLRVVNLLRIVMHYWKCSESLHFVLIYYILSSESLCIVNSLQLRNRTPYQKQYRRSFGCGVRATTWRGLRSFP